MLSKCGTGEYSWESFGQQKRLNKSVLKKIILIFIGRTDGVAEAPILWPPDAKSQRIGKDPDTGKHCGQEEKGTTDDKMVDGIINLKDMSLSTRWEIGKDREAWGAVVHGVTKNWTQLSNWTTTTNQHIYTTEIESQM